MATGGVGAGRGLRHPAGAGYRPGPSATTPPCWHAPWTCWPISARSRRDRGSSRRRLRLGKTRRTLTNLGRRGQIAHKGEKTPIQANRPWRLERTNAWHNAFNRFQRCYERREKVIDAFFDRADAIITVRSLIRRPWITAGTPDLPDNRDQHIDPRDL